MVDLLRLDPGGQAVADDAVVGLDAGASLAMHVDTAPIVEAVVPATSVVAGVGGTTSAMPASSSRDRLVEAFAWPDTRDTSPESEAATTAYENELADENDELQLSQDDATTVWVYGFDTTPTGDRLAWRTLLDGGGDEILGK